MIQLIIQEKNTYEKEKIFTYIATSNYLFLTKCNIYIYIIYITCKLSVI